MEHAKFSSTKTLVENDIPVLLTGPAGTGKTTMAMHIAKSLDLEFFSMSMTKQTTVNAIIGFISINGTYIPSQFRQAFEHGGLFLLDEIDASDPNTILCLNTIENGYVAFPDKVVNKHKDFRLMATANPSTEQSIYTGRSKLDRATIDRFFEVTIDVDRNLEISLASKDDVDDITVARDIMESNGYTQTLSTRDLIRYSKIKKLGVYESPMQEIVNNQDIYKHISDKLIAIEEERRKRNMTQNDATSIDELWNIILNTPADESNVTQLVVDITDHTIINEGDLLQFTQPGYEAFSKDVKYSVFNDPHEGNYYLIDDRGDRFYLHDIDNGDMLNIKYMVKELFKLVGGESETKSNSSTNTLKEIKSYKDLVEGDVLQYMDVNGSSFTKGNLHTVIKNETVDLHIIDDNQAIYTIDGIGSYIEDKFMLVDDDNKDSDKPNNNSNVVAISSIDDIVVGDLLTYVGDCGDDFIYEKGKSYIVQDDGINLHIVDEKGFAYIICEENADYICQNFILNN